MPIIERFLILFATYRDLRVREQISSEELLRLRSRCESLEGKLSEAQDSLVRREREINNKFLGGTLRAVPVYPVPPIGDQEPPKQRDNVHSWKGEKTKEFWDALAARRAELLASSKSGEVVSA